ncbi:hypothetical protein sos41_34720 [Alphaproteobacteria bacterium SO-S41]|nr:hypothetical protein sos41_34720 [Alphaproteobacteria bacterium SO-S41]
MKTHSLILAAFLSSAAMPLAYAETAAPTPVEAVEPAEKAVAAMAAETSTAYANEVAIANMYEIEAANVAWERSTSEDVKAFAKMIIADHTANAAKLKVLVDQAQGDLPDSLDKTHEGMIDALKNADDATFNATYLAQQVDAHTKALELHKAFAKSGDREEFKAFATESAKTVEAHLEQAKALSGGETAPHKMN